MLLRTTHTDTGALVWSPARDRMAYVTSKGLQVYVSDPTSDRERYLTLSERGFSDLTWSETGAYLAGLCDDGTWHVFRFDGLHAQTIYRVAASTLDWFDENSVVYVPDAGGLVLVDLRDTPTEIPLLG